jgi:hypothetical protein
LQVISGRMWPVVLQIDHAELYSINFWSYILCIISPKEMHDSELIISRSTAWSKFLVTRKIVLAVTKCTSDLNIHFTPTQTSVVTLILLSPSRNCLVMRSLHDVHEMVAYRASHICLSVFRMVQLENRWTDSDEIWYGLYAIGDYPKTVHSKFLQSVIPTWRTKKLVR